MGKNTVKIIGNERRKLNLTAGMAARNNIGNEKQMKQSISHRPHLRKNLAAHKSTPAKKLSALERFNRFKVLRDKNLKRQVKKILPGRKVKGLKTPKKAEKNMATETILNGSHDETRTEKHETTSVQDAIASLKLKTPVVELQKELLILENTNSVTTENNVVVENDKEVRNGDNVSEGESETEPDEEKPSSKLRQVRKSKVNENTNKIKDKAKQKRDSKSVTPTRRLSKRIKRQEEERDGDEVNSVFVEELHDIKEKTDSSADMSVSLEHESTPFENDLYAAQLKEPYEQEECADVSKEDEISVDTNESKSSSQEKSHNVTEDDSAVGSSHDFTLSFTEEEEEEREESVNNVASSSVFSLIRRSLRRETQPKQSPLKKTTPEPRTSNVHRYDVSSAEIKIPKHNIYSGISGRKPLRPMYSSYYKIKGSESTNRYSLKRKASDIDSYYDSTEKKRFAGEMGNTSLSEKSPGWKFFSSPFSRFWSPKENIDTSVKSSTPYQKSEISYESMVVNYNEETIAKSTIGTTQIDIDESKTSYEEGNKSLANKYCVIM